MGDPSPTDELEAFEAASSLGRGSMLGAYELLMPIAAGGMGQVWAARVMESEELVAVKTILPVLASDPEVRKMFRDEASIASQIDHPAVCRILEVGDEGLVPFMVLEWVDGDSLRTALRVGEGKAVVAAPPRVVAAIVREVCRGLHAAHELAGADGEPLHAVHRDVSPQNILLSATGDVKVTDFGLVKALGREHVTQGSRPKGKLGFMAPEQLMGEPLDRRADIFAAGCVLYEASTGVHPFGTDGEAQMIAKMLVGNVPPPREVAPDLPEALERIILRCLEKHADERYADANELGEALDTFLEETGGPASKDEIAAFVNERLGEPMAERRERIEVARTRADREAQGLDTPVVVRRRSIPPRIDTPAEVQVSTIRAHVPHAPHGAARVAVLAIAVVVALGLLALGARAGKGDAPRPPVPAAQP